MPNKSQKWVVASRTHENLIDHLLALRQIDDRAAFFQPDFPEHLHDPFLMHGMDIAVSRIIQAIRNHEVIGVFADYDADGTPGAALLTEGLQELGGQIALYLPMRTEGYGLSKKGISKLAEAGARVLITIDLGVTGKELVAYARTLGLDVIITDHHTIQPELFPESALAVLNPKQDQCRYPYKHLCGAGIAWKLLSGVLDEGATHYPDLVAGKNIEAIRRWSLDLAGIATIADIVPLTGENRVLAHYGLRVLQKTRRPGLRALYKLAGVDPEAVNASTVGFQIAPRLNAPTRMAASRYEGPGVPGPQASLSLALLLTDSEEEGTRLAQVLQDHNTERQAQLEEMINEAIEEIEREGYGDQPAIVIAREGWPEGIVGLVAARILERYYRPTFVLSIAHEVAAGSARSVDGFPLVDKLGEVRDLLLSFGGHHKAAGLRMEQGRVAAFRERIVAVAAKSLSADQLIPELRLDATLDDREISLEIAEQLEAFAPFGLGNPRPVFVMPGVRIEKQRLIGREQNHLSLEVIFAGKSKGHRVVGFRLAHAADTLKPGATVDLAVTMQVGSWQGASQLDLKIVAHRQAQVSVESE